MSKIISYLPFLILLFLLVPFVVLFVGIYPAADDFCDYNKLNSGSLISSGMYYYNNWSGRYSAILSALFTYRNIDLVQGYRTVTASFFILFLISIYIFILKIYNNKLISIGISSYLLFYIFSILPTISEGFYWMTGSLAYTVPLSLFLLLISFMISRMEPVSYKNLGFLLPVTFLITGFNETIMILQFVFLAVYGFLDFTRYKKISVPLLLLLITNFIGILIVFFAPGNLIRGAYFPDHKKFAFSILMSIGYSIENLYIWFFSNISFVYGSILLFIYTATSLSYKKIGFRLPHTSNSLYYLTYGLLSIFLGNFVSYWAMGSIPQLRTQNTIQMVFLFSWIIFLVSIAQTYSFRFHFEDRYRSEFIFIVLGIIFLLSCNPKVIRDVYSDLSVNILLYTQDVEMRNKEIEQAKENSERKLLVNKISTFPKLYHEADISSDANSWVNKCYAEFYNIDSVRIN